jgi:hypothetical protein
MPPGKELGAYLSDYVHGVATAQGGDHEVQAMALNTWNALKRSVKGGPRRISPSEEEIEGLLAGRKQTTIAFFLDETFEEITYDMTTTVADAVEVRILIVSELLLVFFIFCSIFRLVEGTQLEMQL